MPEEPTPLPALDVAAMTALLDGRHAEIRALVREQVVKNDATLVGVAGGGSGARDEYRDGVLDLVRQMAGTGATAMGFPEKYGGGGDLGGSVAAFETLAFGDLSVLVKVGVQFGLFGGAILQLGTTRHHREYLPRLVSADLLGCFAMTETGHGSDVQSLQTVATYDADAGEFDLHTPHRLARKDYIGNAARHASVAVVFAQLRMSPDAESEGVHAFVVPIRDEDGAPLPGVGIEDDGGKAGLNGVDNGRLAFDHVRVPRAALLDRYAGVDDAGRYHSDIESRGRRFFTMLGTLIQGRVCVGGAGVNAAKVALTVAVRYALRRRQFGEGGSGDDADESTEQLLLDYGMHQRRLLPLVARTYAMHFAQERLAEQLGELLSGPVRDPDGDVRDDSGDDSGPDSGDDSGEVERERRALESRAAGTKALATWHASRTIQECREACGGAGYLAENRLSTLRADTDVFTTFEGDNHVLLQLVAKGLLTDYSSAFGDLDQLGMVRFVAEQAVETVIERTAVHKLVERIRDILPGGDAWDQEAGVLDPEYQLAMLRWREEHQLAGVARRLKRGVDAGMPAVEVFSRVQDHVIACAHSHVERLVLEAFVDKIAEQPDGPVKDALLVLCDLHALSVIEADRGWWMEHGRLTSQRGKEITRTIADLCRQLRPRAEQLVDGFGVPREIRSVPLLDQSQDGSGG